MKQTKEKVRLFISIGLICAIVLQMFIVMPIHAFEPDTNKKQAALNWLKEQVNHSYDSNEYYPDNDSANIMAVGRLFGEKYESGFMKEWAANTNNYDNDVLAHLSWGMDDKDYLIKLWNNQNSDGGFGLNNNYTSDCYDTLLALMAAAEYYRIHGAELYDLIQAEKVTTAAEYLINCQNADGGIGYHITDESREGLSCEIGITLLTLDFYSNTFYGKLDNYCLTALNRVNMNEDFSEWAELLRYLYRRELSFDTENAEALLENIQQSDGSVNSSIDDTLQYVLLMDEIEKYHILKLNIDDMTSIADSYVLEAGSEQEIGVDTNITYSINQNKDMILRYELLNGDEQVYSKDVEMALTKDNSEVENHSDIRISAKEEDAYHLKIYLIDTVGEEETIYAENEISFTIHKKEKTELKLTCTVNGGADYGVNLAWNEISDNDEKYGYRILRKQEGGEWETRSTWDGEEKVRVLNIYPKHGVKTYLKTWMNTTIKGTGESVGKNLFDIDIVYIYDYNLEPDKYLFDEEGNYKYDVLMFGTADNNGNADLTEKSYEATRKFIETGRGVLFGHDTVVYWMKYFSKFADLLGVKLGHSYTLSASPNVKVVNEGFLTSYPWKLSGTLKIPATHTQAQYTGGSLPSTVWMELQTGYDTDAETGATTSAYLFTNNQLAMIQTGHSGGAATDDERKVIANTLFYLKQYTYSTNMSDKSFYDLEAPEITDIEISEDGSITLYGEDKGTTYQYYVEGIATSSENENVQSNIVTATALSGLKGFIVKISDKELIEDMVEYDENGNIISEITPSILDKATFSLDEYEPGTTVYIHICPVDNAGNVGEEIVDKIEIPNGKSYLNLPYVLFASENEVQLYCSQADITGNIYGNETFKFQGSTLNLLGMAYSTGELMVAGGNLHIAKKLENASQIELPDYMTDILNNMNRDDTTIEETAEYSITTVMKPTICKTTTGAWCSSVNIFADLASKESISLNANDVTLGDKEPVVIASENGDINIQATKVSGNGLIYAPNGTVTINVCDFDYKGSIIAKKIQIQATYYKQEIEDK